MTKLFKKPKKKPSAPRASVQPLYNQSYYWKPQSPFQPHGFQTEFRLITARPGTEEIPVVFITPEAYAEMLFLCQLSDYDEIGWLGHVRELEGNRFLIDEIFVIDQEVTGASCEMTEEGLEDLGTELADQGLEDKNNRILFWGHLHPSGSTNPSVEDERQMSETFGHTNFFIRGIFGRTGRAEFTFFDYLNGIRWNDIPWRIHTELSPDRKDFLAKEVAQKVRKGRVATTYYYPPVVQSFHQYPAAGTGQFGLEVEEEGLPPVEAGVVVPGV